MSNLAHKINNFKSKKCSNESNYLIKTVENNIKLNVACFGKSENLTHGFESVIVFFIVVVFITFTFVIV